MQVENENVTTPSEEIIKNANQSVEVLDELGRNIKVKKASILSKLRLVEALDETSKNDMYLGMVMPLIYIVSIDGKNAPPLSTKNEIEGYINVVGESGLLAVADGLKKLGIL